MKNDNAKIVKQYLKVLKKLSDGSKAVDKKLSVFFKYCVTKKGRKPDRNNYPDRALNPSLNGTIELLSEFKRCAFHFLPGEAPEEINRELRKFLTETTTLLDTIEKYKRIESLNISLTVVSDIVKYLTIKTHKETPQDKHEQIVSHYIKCLKDSFYKNSDAMYSYISTIIEAQDTGHQKLEKIINSVSSVKDDTGLLVRRLEATPDVRIKGNKLVLWRQLNTFMENNPDRKEWTLPKCCHQVYKKLVDGFSTEAIFLAYAYSHRRYLPL